MHERDNSPFNKKMRTIKEEDEGKFSGSDTGYFSNEDDFNNRDEHYDSDEEEEYRKRKQQLLDGDIDDEDNQPYD